jgi:hypothetical protein
VIPLAVMLWAREAQARTGASDMAAALALAVSGPESSYQADALGDWTLDGRLVSRGTPGAVPTSFGLTQLHTPVGLGDGHAIDELLDGSSNLAIAQAYIQARLDAGAQPIAALQPWSTRTAALAQLADVQVQLGTVPRGGAASATAASGLDSGAPVVGLSLTSLNPQQRIALGVTAAAAVGLWLLLD